MILFHAFIPGPVRGGKNKVGMTRTGHRYPLPHFVKWRNEAMPYVMGRCRRIEAPVKGTFIYVPEDRRRRDVTAMLDALFHLLERGGVIKDDSLIKDVVWETRRFDPGGPGVSIVLETK